MKETRYLSFDKIWSDCVSIGVGIGWSKEDHTFCVFVPLGFRLLILGPHLKTQKN
jgi:hypothetical protein